MRKIAALGVAFSMMVLVTGCRPDEEPVRGLAISRAGGTAIAMPPVCATAGTARIEVWSVSRLEFPQSKLWSARTVDAVVPGQSLALTPDNPELENVTGNYPIDAKVMIVFTFDTFEMAEVANLSDIPDSHILYGDEILTADDYASQVSVKCGSS